MRILAKTRILLLATAVMVIGLDAGERLAVPGVSGFVAVAEARIGRPLTPFSVAGVARRTVRRCAVGVYYC